MVPMSCRPPMPHSARGMYKMVSCGTRRYHGFVRPPLESRLIWQSGDQLPLGRITAGAFLKNSPGIQGPPRIFGQYALVYLLEGGGSFVSPVFSTPVRPGDLFVVFPDVPHTYGPPADGAWSEFYLVFDGPLFDLWRNKGILRPQAPLYHLEPQEYWLNRLTEICRPLQGRQLMLSQLTLLQHLLADVEATRAVDGRNQPDMDWLEEAKRLLRAGAGEKTMDLPAVARRLGIAYEPFRKRFTRLAGVSPSRFRAGGVMETACRMLVETDLPLRRIARDCGFCDEFHFSRRFKRLMGVSPSGFRGRRSESP